MKTLVIFYSFSGNIRAISQELAEKESFGIAEIKDAKGFGKLKAYTLGCFASIRGKPWPVQPLGIVFSEYGRLVLLAPVWASNPPPAVNAFFELLPPGKDVAVKMVSASGRSGCRARIESAIESKGCALESFEDIQAPKRRFSAINAVEP